MPLDFDTRFDTLSYTGPQIKRLYYTVDGIRYEPITNNMELTLNNERTEKKMEVKDKICDKCGKRYSVADMRVKDKNGTYTDKECYFDNSTPVEDYPKMYHSRTDEKYVGRVMDLCPECATELKKFAGEGVI